MKTFLNFEEPEITQKLATCLYSEPNKYSPDIFTPFFWKPHEFQPCQSQDEAVSLRALSHRGG